MIKSALYNAKASFGLYKVGLIVYYGKASFGFVIKSALHHVKNSFGLVKSQA